MGCATSKQKPVCRNCQAPCSPPRRSYTIHSPHEPPPRKSESSHQHHQHHHVVALTSTTLGSFRLDPTGQDHHSNKENVPMEVGQKMNGPDENEFSMGLIEAKTWSTMINEKIIRVVPKTPILTPPGEPETINTWELMEGLDGITPLRSFSFHVSPNGKPIPSTFENPESEFQQNGDFSPNPTPNSGSNSSPIRMIPEFDPRGKEKVVVYFTSLRGVRKTFEDCCNVREILKRLGVKVDERDVSMDLGFKEELKELLGEEGFSGGGRSGLPRVFLGNKYIGGAEEVQRMHEEGRLEKAVEGCEMVVDGSSRGCEACGDIRFVPCEMCAGSCKIYCEEDYGEDCEESEYGFQRCPHCNENGLIRCPICCN